MKKVTAIPTQLKKKCFLFRAFSLTETIRDKAVSHKRGRSRPKLDPKSGHKS